MEYSLLVSAGAQNDLSSLCSAGPDTHHRSVDLAAATDRKVIKLLEIFLSHLSRVNQRKAGNIRGGKMQKQ